MSAGTIILQVLLLYSIFGGDSDSDRLAEKFSPELWQFYLQIREEREEDELDDE